MDALLVFDCLIYLNAYYYFMFTLANLGIWVAKNFSEAYLTPNIWRDAYVAATLCISELLKLLLFKKLRDRHAVLSVLVALIFAVVSVLGVLYVLLIQWPVLRLEMCLDIMLFILLIAQLFWGLNSFLPCCSTKEF